MDEIFDKIREERARQDIKWGGKGNDDLNTFDDWGYYIDCQLKSKSGSQPEEITFIKIAALAVAALESIERKNNG